VCLAGRRAPCGADLEVAKRLRQQPDFSSVLVVAMIVYGQLTDILRSREAGFDLHSVKPANFGQLLQILATVSVERPEPREPGMICHTLQPHRVARRIKNP
jgi:CheY-like chemotaxis protein